MEEGGGTVLRVELVCACAGVGVRARIAQHVTCRANTQIDMTAFSGPSSASAANTGFITAADVASTSSSRAADFTTFRTTSIPTKATNGVHSATTTTVEVVEEAAPPIASPLPALFDDFPGDDFPKVNAPW